MKPFASGALWSVILGDALRVLPGLESGSFAAMVTDCPYSSGGATRGDRAASTKSKYVNSDSGTEYLDFAGDSRDQRSFAHWAALWYIEALRLCEDGALLLSFTDWRQLPATTDAVQAGGWVWRGIVPWSKTNPRPQSGRPSAQCEYVVWGTKGPMVPWSGAPCVPGFYEMNTERERLHIAQKPVALMASMCTLVRPEGAILDPFAGSGSTGVGAIRAGRRVVLVECMEANAEVIARRLEAEEAGLDLAAVDAGQTSLLGAP